jgi:hypothetical protein
MVDALALMLAEKVLESIDDLLLDRRLLGRCSRRIPMAVAAKPKTISEIVAMDWRMPASRS